MEWQLPIQKVEIGNIHIGSPWAREQRRELISKPMAPLSYFGTQFRLPFVSLLFPPLPIVEYNPVTGKLVLDMSETNLACIKLSTFQETLVNAIVYHQHGWFKSEFKKEDVKGGFQPILEGGSQLHFHIGGPGADEQCADLQGWGVDAVGLYGGSENGNSCSGGCEDSWSEFLDEWGCVDWPLPPPAQNPGNHRTGCELSRRVLWTPSPPVC
jgi:hypothetical protein